MDTHATEEQLLRRQLFAAVANLLAEPLEGEGREAFFASAHERLNAAYPAPSRQRMRAYLSRKIDT